MPATEILNDKQDIVFNKEDELDMKYDIKPIAHSANQNKKRHIDNISQQPRFNPFAKESKGRQDEVTPI